MSVDSWTLRAYMCKNVSVSTCKCVTPWVETIFIFIHVNCKCYDKIWLNSVNHLWSWLLL